MKTTVFEAFKMFVLALLGRTKNEKLVKKLISAGLPEDQEKLIAEFDSVVNSSITKLEEGETVTWQKAMMIATYLLFARRQERKDQPEVSHLGSSDVDFVTVPWGAEDQVAGQDEILMSEGLELDGQQMWRILGEAASAAEYGDHRQLQEFGPELCKLDADPLWWTYEEIDPLHHLDAEEFKGKLGPVNWSHVLPLSDARDQIMWLLFWDIKDARTVEQLADVARKARKQSQAAILRKAGKVQKDGKWIPVDTSSLPTGLDYRRFARVVNTATKKAAYLLGCDVSSLGKPFGVLKIEDRSTPKEEKPEIDALDAPKAGEFMADLQAVDGIGDILESRLIDEFGSIEAAMRATCSELMRVRGIGRAKAEKIFSFFASVEIPTYKASTRDWKDETPTTLVYHMSPEEIEEFNPQFSYNTSIQSFRMSDAEVIAWQGNRSIR